MLDNTDRKVGSRRSNGPSAAAAAEDRTRDDALRTHDRLASQAPRTHPTAKQLPLMRKTHG